jgi:hypothetical protein
MLFMPSQGFATNFLDVITALVLILQVASIAQAPPNIIGTALHLLAPAHKPQAAERVTWRRDWTKC